VVGRLGSLMVLLTSERLAMERGLDGVAAAVRIIARDQNWALGTNGKNEAGRGAGAVGRLGKVPTARDGWVMLTLSSRTKRCWLRRSQVVAGPPE